MIVRGKDGREVREHRGGRKDILSEHVSSMSQNHKHIRAMGPQGNSEEESGENTRILLCADAPASFLFLPFPPDQLEQALTPPLMR